MPTRAEDLKCGDVFIFRNEEYTTIACVDYSTSRDVSVIAFKIRLEEGVFALCLFRYFEVEVVNHVEMTITRVDHTPQELGEL